MSEMRLVANDRCPHQIEKPKHEEPGGHKHKCAIGDVDMRPWQKSNVCNECDSNRYDQLQTNLTNDDSKIRTNCAKCEQCRQGQFKSNTWLVVLLLREFLVAMSVREVVLTDID